MKDTRESREKQLKIEAREKIEKFRRDYGHRFLFKAMGFSSKELSLPRIAVVNSWSEQSPGQVHLKSLAEGVKAGIRMAGGMPFEINVIGPCTGLGKTISETARYDLPQREAILASIESALHVGWCDGWVGIGTCDKIIPGMILAALRLNRPFIFIGGGPMVPRNYRGEWLGYGRAQDMMFREFQEVSKDSSRLEQYEQMMEEITDYAGSCAGACPEMTTGSTLTILTEAMGFSLPGSSTSPGVFGEKMRYAKDTGSKIVELVQDGIKPSDIFSLNSVRNAIAIDMTTAGGSNSVVHLQSFAHEACVPVTLDTWDEMSRKVPVLCPIAPSGPFSLVDFHEAGGVPAAMKRIRALLDETCLTVTGKTIKDILDRVEIKDSNVIRPIDDPVWPEGALSILRGNLAPRGAVTRHTVVENKELLNKTLTARVFDSLEDVIETILSGRPRPIGPDEAIICRFEGPRGGPAMSECLSIIRALKMADLKDIVVISDGRFSGFTKDYLTIGHVCPEAQVGGPIAVLEDGDQISIDISSRKLNVELSDEEIEKRKRVWTPPIKSEVKGVLAMYAKTALQADQGAGWPTRWEDFGPDTSSGNS
jgi:dihydroxy-acid dehydratase